MGHSIGAISTRILMFIIAVIAAAALCAPAAWADEKQATNGDGQESAALVEMQDEEAAATEEAVEVEAPAEGLQEEPEEPVTDGGEAPAVEAPAPSEAGLESAGDETPVPAQPDANPQEQVAQPNPAPVADAQPVAAAIQTPAKRASSTPAKTSAAGDPARTVADGVYWIASSKNAKQAIVVAKKSNQSGAYMELATKAKRQAYQKWKFTWKNGYYEIVNLKSGKVLAVSSNRPGSKVVQVKRANTAKEHWKITLSKSGKSCIIKNAWSGKVLNLNGSAEAGTTITALKVNGKSSQWFMLKNSKAIDAGTYQLFTTLDKKFALYAPKSKKGTQLAIAKKKATKPNQRFYIRNESGDRYSIQSVATGMFVAEVNGKAVLLPWAKSDKRLLWDCAYVSGYQFRNASTGKAMLVSGGKAESKAPVATGAAGNGKSKKWAYLPRPLIARNTYSIKASNGTALEVANGSYAKGANVRTAAEAPKAGSECFEVQPEGQYFRLVNMRTFQAVAVKDASKESGANVVQVPVSSARSQLWKATINRNGAITFANVRSKMVLQTSGKKNNVNQGEPASKSSQAFKLVPAKCYSLSGNKTLDKNVATILSNYTTLRSCFSYVTHFSYREGARFWGGGHYLSEGTTISYANDMVAHHSGNCYRFASLFSWLARGLGYSTKVASGHVPSAAGGLAPHGWTWIYQNGKGYICDPDLNHEMPGYNWFMTTWNSAPCAYGYW